MNGKDFFQMIGEKFGMNSEQISTFINNKSIESISIEDDVVSAFKSIQVFTEDSAKANSSIRAAIRAEALNGVDADIKRLMDKHEFSDDIKAEISKQDKTSARIEKFYEKLSELEKAKVGTTGKEKSILEKEIEKLHFDLKSEKDSRLNDEIKFKNELESNHTNWELKNLYSSLDIAIPDNFDADVIKNGAKYKIESELVKRGVSFKMTESGLAPFTKDGTPYFENNVKISANDLLRKVATENKLLKVANTKPLTPQNKMQTQTPINNNAGLLINSSILDNSLSEGIERDFK